MSSMRSSMDDLGTQIILETSFAAFVFGEG
jgi:hypothetical protein